ncbi:hypothetical protein Ocin01_18000 [Orchesella cincta]|uniref:C-type lectin domain-containing protein n=1 Tax=Orchesella cincta TaxID=48709 RepID=A0A1D2M6Y6_ORCCI|nr:hypothetical protein Ocin01_18000 [Orchesella cincta]
MEATTYCHSAGLQLATIQTENEALFLKLSYDHDYFISLYWTAARDSQKPRALSWDNTGTEPETLTSIRWRNTVREYQICAAFSSWPTPGQYRVMLPCSAPIGTLCQGL